MSSTDLHTAEGSTAESAEHADGETHGHAHPSDKQYVMIALLLAAITAAEVATYALDFFDDFTTAALVATLFPMMILKFGIVCAYFMHLRYDNPIFRRIFVFGLILAIIVYCIALSAMQFWTHPAGVHPGA